MNALTGPDTAPLLSLAAMFSKYPFAFELKTVPVVQKAFFPRRPPLSKETSVKLLNMMDQIHGVLAAKVSFYFLSMDCRLWEEPVSGQLMV